jgi:uncharacterized membrane protein YedE/YeeE
VDVTAPLPLGATLGEGSSLAIALVIGIAFGATLERAGLGSAQKLAGQFYLTDFTVLKVMFSAIITAMLGLFWLGRLGVLDLSRVYVPETYLIPQLAGGLVFGTGFVMAGLCPGTSCVAAATGRIDGAVTVAGMFAGVLVTGAAYRLIERFAGQTALGVRRVPEVLHLSYGATVLGVVVAALVAFAVAERLERRTGTEVVS